MASRSYQFGELRKIIQESASEFKPKFGDGVEAKDKEINREAYRDIEKETSEYDGGVTKKKQSTGQAELAKVNLGMSDLQYDGEIGEKFRKNVQAGLEGYTSDLEKKNHSNEDLGNATRSDKIAKELEKTARSVKQMQDAQAEVGITNAQKPKDMTHMHTTNIGESAKTSLLKFKHVQFLSESHMLKHVPDEYKTEGRKFYMQDCKGNKYLVEWHEEPEVERMLNEQSTKSEMDRIKYLFNYSGKKLTTSNSMMMNENKNVEDMVGRVKGLMKSVK